jgi:penicillin-insensitive murein endopeptidase
MSQARRPHLLARALIPACVLLGAISAVTPGVSAAANVGAHQGPSRSIGAPNAGRLENGVHVERSAIVRYVAAYDAGDRRWGVRELVDAIDRGAREVRRRYPDAVLGVGQLSQRTGGDIDRHRSHESGRDADLAFFLVDSSGRAQVRDRFMTVRPDGTVVGDQGLRFDDGRNWTLVSALLSDPKARVTHIFVATPLRTRLLAYGARVGASPELRTRVADVLMQPRHSLPHDDHFHVRIACPTTSPACIEWPTATGARAPTTTGVKLHVAHPTRPTPKRTLRARATGRVQIESIPLGVPYAAPNVPTPASEVATPAPSPAEGTGPAGGLESPRVR